MVVRRRVGVRWGVFMAELDKMDTIMRESACIPMSLLYGFGVSCSTFGLL